MSTPTTTFLLPYPPATPAPTLLTTDCDIQIPILCLPPALATTQNVVLPTISSNQSSFIANQQESLPVNPLPTSMTSKEQIRMTVVSCTRE